MRWILAFLFASLASAAAAESHGLDADKQLVLACNEQLGQTTEWGQCLQLTFQPCADHTPESEAHVACVTNLRDEWLVVFEDEQARVKEVITDQGADELTQLINGWGTYVSQKCNEVSLQRGGSIAAKNGCEVAELVSATSEFLACRAGLSTAPFCVFRDN